MKTPSPTDFDGLGLSPEILANLAAQGYEEATPVQAAAIPKILAGRDVLASAQTGTGKTAAFALPTLQRLASTPARKRRRTPRALILTPTRELAAQVDDCFQTYGKKVPVSASVVFGGVGIRPQINRLGQGVDILTATPGRLLDLNNQDAVDLSKIEILVLDEADRMLDMGFLPDIRRILQVLPDSRQNLLFSATYSDEIRKLSSGLLDDPAVIEVAPRNATTELVTQSSYHVAKSEKQRLLSRLIRDGNWFQVLVFSRTKHGADRIARRLKKDGIDSAAIHSNRSQSQRTRTIRDFKKAKIQALVATDIAARGLDISDLPYVINFDLPDVPEDYVHRIGRTGRAGVEGEAISFVTPEEADKLWAIEKILGRPLDVNEHEDFESPEFPERPAPRNKTGKKKGRRRNQRRRRR